MESLAKDNDCEVLLIQPKIALSMDVNFLPFGLLFVASSLRRKGYHPRVIDLNVESLESLIDALQSTHLLYVGFSVFTGPIVSDVIEISMKIRQLRPDLPIVWGGPHPTILPDLTARHQLVDVACRGEGEETAVLLADAFAENTDLHDVPGITFKRGSDLVSTPNIKNDPDVLKIASLDLNSIDLYPYIFLNRGKKCVSIITSRGCPYRCSFCWNVMFHDRRYKGWPIDKVSQELRPLFDMGVEKFLLFDSFVGSISRVRALGELFKSECVEWAMEDGCRVDLHGTEECFQILSETGCTHVAFGAESGSQRILDLLRKDLTVDDIIQSAQSRKNYNIGARYQWMVGIPGETREDVLKTVDTIDRICNINPKSAHSVDIYSPYPGCEIFKKACDAGWQPPSELEDWGKFRWEGKYPHHNGDTWLFKSIFYSNIFYRYNELSRYSAYTEKARPIYKAACFLLHPIAKARWKTRYFGMPIEYMIAENIRRFIENKI